MKIYTDKIHGSFILELIPFSFALFRTPSHPELVEGSNGRRVKLLCIISFRHLDFDA